MKDWKDCVVCHGSGVIVDRATSEALIICDLRPVSRGTPQSISKAIENYLRGTPIVLMSQYEASCMSDGAAAHVRDFLAQKFSTAMLKSPDHADELKALFDELTRGA